VDGRDVPAMTLQGDSLALAMTSNGLWRIVRAVASPPLLQDEVATFVAT